MAMEIDGYSEITLLFAGVLGDPVTAEKCEIEELAIDTFKLTPKEKEGKLPKDDFGGNVKLYVSGELNATIHTSGAKPLEVFQMFGDFYIIGFVVVPKKV